MSTFQSAVQDKVPKLKLDPTRYFPTLDPKISKRVVIPDTLRSLRQGEKRFRSVASSKKRLESTRTRKLYEDKSYVNQGDLYNSIVPTSTLPKGLKLRNERSNVVSKI